MDHALVNLFYTIYSECGMPEQVRNKTYNKNSLSPKCVYTLVLRQNVLETFLWTRVSHHSKAVLYHYLRNPSMYGARAACDFYLSTRYYCAIIMCYHPESDTHAESHAYSFL